MRFDFGVYNFDNSISLGIDFGCKDTARWWLPYLSVHIGWWSVLCGWWPVEIEFFPED